MQRLTGADATFLYMETPTSPMHVAGLAVLDPSGVPDWGVDKMVDMVSTRLHLAPPYRRRLKGVPFGLHHPVWVEDPDFDLEWHIRNIAVPPPGGARELGKLAAHLMSLPLDRSHPLWEMWLIEGLEHGYVGVLTKVHHAAIDGASGNELTVSIYDLTPEGNVVPPPEEPWSPDHVPSDLEMLGYALNSLARQPLRAIRTARRTAAVALNLRQLNRRLPDTDPPPAPLSAPRTSINAALTPQRSYAFTTLSLADVKQVKNAFGTTVNDVVLALCGGALRRYFDERGEGIEGPLVAMVPVSVRSEAEKSAMGNRVSSAMATLATDVDDPVDRLQAVHRGMERAKEQQKVIGADMLQDWTEFAAPAVFSRAARLYSRTRIADRHRPLFNVTISNVPGPPFPLYSAGARLVANYPMGPIFDGGGLNMTVMSYQDSMDFGLVACPDVVDDVWAIADHLGEALEELVKAAAQASGQRAASTMSTTPTTPTARATARKATRAKKAAKPRRKSAPAKAKTKSKAKASTKTKKAAKKTRAAKAASQT